MGWPGRSRLRVSGRRCESGDRFAPATISISSSCSRVGADPFAGPAPRPRVFPESLLYSFSVRLSATDPVWPDLDPLRIMGGSATDPVWVRSGSATDPVSATSGSATDPDPRSATTTLYSIRRLPASPDLSQPTRPYFLRAASAERMLFRPFTPHPPSSFLRSRSLRPVANSR